MHDLLVKSVPVIWLFRGRFPVAPSSYILKAFRAVYRRYDFRYVKLLATEILRQDQNFQNTPNTIMVKSDYKLPSATKI